HVPAPGPGTVVIIRTVSVVPLKVSSAEIVVAQGGWGATTTPVTMTLLTSPLAVTRDSDCASSADTLCTLKVGAGRGAVIDVLEHATISGPSSTAASLHTGLRPPAYVAKQNRIGVSPSRSHTQDVRSGPRW